MKDIPHIAKELFGDNHPAQCNGGHIICLNCYHCHLKFPDQIYDPHQGLASVIDATILRQKPKKKRLQNSVKRQINTKLLPFVLIHILSL